jgi:hypothetical protein
MSAIGLSGCRKQEQAAARLRHPGQRRPRAPGRETERLEPAARAGEAGAAEPAEELLRAVADPQRAGDDAKNEQTDIGHRFTP